MSGSAEQRPSASAASPWEGRVIDGRYRILRPLAEGAMGQVFVAEHEGLHKEVALKVVHPEIARHPEVAARFAREAQAGSRIDHSSVVAALDYGQLDEGGAYLVMRLARGSRFGDFVEQHGRLPWPLCAELGAQIAGALAAAWAEGFVHRDLKPDNVLVEGRDGAPPLAQVLDFGVAGLAPRSSTSPRAAPGAQPLTKEGTIIGTPGYMAPEQALGQPATHSADLYSLGVILWEGLVGQPLWTGDSAHQIMRAQLKLQRPTPREASGDSSIPAELDRLVMRLLAVRPEHRPQSAEEVCGELRRLAQSAGALAVPAGHGRRSRAGTALALLVAFGLSALLAFAFFRGLR